jgi:hypothetical protein
MSFSYVIAEALFAEAILSIQGLRPSIGDCCAATRTLKDCRA